MPVLRCFDIRRSGRSTEIAIRHIRWEQAEDVHKLQSRRLRGFKRGIARKIRQYIRWFPAARTSNPI